MTTASPTRVLFLCTHNSARSQMAEGLLRALGGDRFEVASAGTEATAVRPEAFAVMREIGIDLSGQTSKTLERYLDKPFDLVITVCDAAAESCPVFLGARRRLHWSFPDPSPFREARQSGWLCSGTYGMRSACGSHPSLHSRSSFSDRG